MNGSPGSSIKAKKDIALIQKSPEQKSATQLSKPVVLSVVWQQPSASGFIEIL